MPISAIGNRSPASRRPETEAGFTLVEIMVVLTIVGLTAAVAALALPDGGAAARQEAERLGARLLAARDHALFTQSETAAVIDADGYRFEARGTDGEWAGVDARSLKPRRFEDVTASAASALPLRVRFDAVGLSDPVRIRLTGAGGRPASVQVDGSGDVRVAE